MTKGEREDHLLPFRHSIARIVEREWRDISLEGFNMDECFARASLSVSLHSM